MKMMNILDYVMERLSWIAMDCNNLFSYKLLHGKLI